MTAAERLVAGRVAISIREIEKATGRGHSYIYRAIGRGKLRMFGPGRVSADSFIEWCKSFEAGGHNPDSESRQIGGASC